MQHGAQLATSRPMVGSLGRCAVPSRRGLRASVLLELVSSSLSPRALHAAKRKCIAVFRRSRALPYASCRPVTTTSAAFVHSSYQVPPAALADGAVFIQERMTTRGDIMKRITLWLLAALIGTLCGVSMANEGNGRDDDNDLRITAVSSRPDTVSGGNALLRVETLRARPLSGIRVFVNRLDVSSAFELQTDGSLLGLVTGLQLGRNEVFAEGTHHRGRGDDFGHASLVLTNFPIGGPIFSGPHESPFVCMTAQFTLPASTATLGAPLDSDCSINTRVDYVYRASNNTFKPLPTGGGHPTDLVNTTTTQGKTVPYIVRVETGTINRAIYQTAMLHDPLFDPAPTPFAPPPSWNGRLVYTLGGGCVGGYYIQGRSIGNGGILEDMILRQGFGIASSTLNVFGNNCQQVLAAETLSMVRERFIENFGPVFYTMGYGCSGGSEQAQPISDEYPGLVDGILIGCSFPELTAGITLDITDADLFNHYLTSTALTWLPTQQNAATGYPTITTPASIGPGNAVRTKAQGGACNAGIPVAQRFDQVTNPHGVRCDIYDHMVNIFGRDPSTGYARRPLDNVGVQYGLGALRSGAITVDQFIDLNQKIGGYDNNGNYVATRSVGDLKAIRIAYETGQITYGGRGMRETPIIDYRGYVDQPENGNEVHARFHSFSMRERLIRANGNFDNQVMLIEDGVSAGSVGLFNDVSVVLTHAVTQMDQWLTGIKNDDSGRPATQKMRRAKPADLVDACFTDGGHTKIAELQVYKGNTRCNQLYPAFSTPRMVAGEPLANDVLKCQLKRIDTRDYNVRLTSAQEAQLRAIFPTGVCDYDRPGVEQEPTEDLFAFF
jgi:hypothetical protein